MADPSTIFGGSLFAWYRPAEIASGRVIGDGIDTWADASGNARDATQATTTKRPTLQQVTNGSATFYVARFDKVDDYLRTTDVTSLAQPALSAVVFQATSTVNQRLIDGNTTAARQLIDINAVKWRIFGTVGVSSTEAATTNWTVVVGVFNGASSTVASNGGAVTTGNPGVGVSNGGTTIGIDGNALSAVPFGGDIAEIIRVSGSVTSDQIIAYDSYVQETYGVAVADYILSVRKRSANRARFRASFW